MIWLKSGNLEIYKAHTFVVDEADMTLDMGFLDTVDKIASTLPKDVQILVFSATIPQKLQPFLKKYLTNPVMEQIKLQQLLRIPLITGWYLLRVATRMNRFLRCLRGCNHTWQ